MPEPQQPQRLHSATEFAAVMRRLYPQLGEATDDDNKLTSAILSVHPEFRDHVIDPMGGMEGAPKPPALPNFGAGLPKGPVAGAPPEPVSYQSLARGGPSGSAPQPPTALGEMLTEIVSTPVRGAVRAAKGISELSRGMPGAVQDRQAPPSWEDMAQSGSEVIGGGMEAASPLIIPALIANPWATIPALIAGTAAATGVEKGGEALGAPPGYVHLASEIAGLIGGVAAGEGAGVWRAKVAERAKAPIYDQLRTEDQNFTADAAREHAFQEQGMRADFAAENALKDDDQSLLNVLAFKDQQVQEREFAKLLEAWTENDRLNQLAQQLKVEQASHSSPFETVEAFTRKELPPGPPEPVGLLGPGSPAKFLAEASDQEFPGRMAFDPNTVDVVDPSVVDQRPVATSEAPPPPLINQLGEQLSSELSNQPPAALQPRPSAPTRVKMQERQDFQAMRRRTAHDAVSEMEYMTHARGSQFDDPTTGETYYTPPVAGSEWYWRVVGKEAQNPPTRAVITELMRTYAESGGKMKGAELTEVEVNRLKGAVDLKTEGGARRAYDRWAEDIDQAVQGRANANLYYERMAKERAAMEERAQAREAAQRESQGTENVPPEETTPPVVEGESPVEPGEAGPPSPVDEEMPGFLRDLQREDVAGAFDEETLPLPGMEAGAIQNPEAGPVADLPQPRFDLTGDEGPAPKQSSLRDIFERLVTEDEGSVGVPPMAEKALRTWLEKRAAEYGEEDWHQKATEALDQGDTRAAWRISAFVAAKSYAATGTEEKRSGPMVEVQDDQPGYKNTKQYKQQRVALEDQLGGDLPKGIDLNASGMMTFGKPESNLKAAATDLLLGKNFAHEVIEAADPTQIVRVEGNRDPDIRINRQIAEQLVKSMPDEIVEPLMEILKIEDRAEFAKHFARTVSSWGKGLRMLKDWQDDHWDDFYHVLRVGGGSGEGDVVGLSDIRTPNGFIKWLNTEATQADLDRMNFKLPKNIKAGTEEADNFGKSWFRAKESREARRIALAKTLDELAQDGSTLDKAMLAGALDAEGKSRGTLDAVENTSRAFMISQPATLIRNLWTQAGRYSIGVLDDALASSYSMLAMDPKSAERFMTRAAETAKGVGREGNVSAKSLKTPWLDSLETIYDFTADSINDLSPEDMRKTIKLMDEFPRRASTYSGGLSLDNRAPEARQTSKIPGVTKLIQPEVRNFVTVLGRTQEMAFRGAVFDSSVRAGLRDMGLDPNVELAGDPTKLIGKLGEKKVDQLIGGAVASALDYTFAAKPYPGSIPAALLNAFTNIPVFSALLRTGFPFPRFNWVSAPRWIYDHSPMALLDIPMGIMGHFTSEGAPLKGRLYRGMEAQKIQDTLIPHLTHQIGATEWTISTKLQEFVSSKVEAQAAAKSFRALEKRAEKSGMLPEIHDEIVSVGNEMQAKIAQAQEAKQAHADATTQLKELKRQQKNAEEKLLKIKEIGAPTIPEYFARMTTGGAMLGAAYLMRSSDNAKDTKWYEFNVEAPGFGKHTLDLRAFAPMAQFLLPADIMHSVQSETDWKGFHAYLEKHPGEYEKAIKSSYHGKYTKSTASKEAATAFLSISPAAGVSAGIIDYLTGRSGADKEGVLQSMTGAVLTTVGQFLGRFTVPLRPIKDVIGQFSEEERKARIPRDSSDQPHHAEELYGPALANIPFASRAIPEKKSPLTGEAIGTVNPMARAFAGLTERDRNRFEEEIAHTGIEYSKMVPRQTGDREFDNAVAEAYHTGLVKYGSKLLDNKQYKGMTPELRRDVLGSAFGGLKQYALYEAGKKLGLTGAATHDKVESPGVKEKRERWKGYLETLRQETEKDHPTPVEGAPPEARNDSGAPPEALGPESYGGSDRFSRSVDSGPPAGL